MTFKQPGFSLHAGTSPAKAKPTVEVTGAKEAREEREKLKAPLTKDSPEVSPAKKYRPEPPRKKKTVDKKRAGLFKRGEEKTTNYKYNDKGEVSSTSSKTRETRSLVGRVFKKGKYTGSGSTGRAKYKDGKPVIRTSGTYRTKK